MADKNFLTKSGRKRLATAALKGVALNLQLRVFTNDIEVADSTVAGDFTSPTFPGYSPRQMPTSGWSEPRLTDEGIVELLHIEQVFTYTELEDPQQIQGFYVVDTTDGSVIWIQKYADALNIEGDGEFAISPAMYFGSEA